MAETATETAKPQKENFAALLEDALAVEVVNAAVSGYELIHQLQYFRSFGAALDPDLVVLMLNTGNDLAYNRDWELEGERALAREDLAPVRALPPADRRILGEMIERGLRSPATTSAASFTRRSLSRPAVVA